MSFIYTNRTGTGFNTGQTGTQAGTGGGGGGGILLPDLIGWSFVSGGPQQTLSSAGLVASGPYDLTATGTGSISYSASGARIQGDSSLLKDVGDLTIGAAQPFLVCAKVSSIADLGTQFIWFELFGLFADSAMASDLNNVGGSFFSVNFYGNGDDGYVEAAADTSIDRIVFAYFDPSTNRNYGKSNGVAIFSAACVPFEGTVHGAVLDIGGYPGGWSATRDITVSNCRWWLGETARTIWETPAYMTFLETNPTDADLAAYTG